MRTLRARVRDEDGAIAILAGVLVSAVVLAGALAVDVGRVAYVSRDQQGSTDRAALDGIQALSASDVPARASLDEVAEVHAEASASLERNPSSGTARERRLYRVDLGRADSDDPEVFQPVCGEYFDDAGAITDRASLQAAGVLAAPEASSTAATHQTAPVTCGPGGGEGQEVDAIRLWTHGAVAYVLAIGGSGTDLHRVASARSTWAPDDEHTFDPVGTLTAGSRLARVDADVLDDLLDGLLGSSVSLDLVSYQGVAGGGVRLADLVRTGHLGVGSVEELLTAEITFVDLVQASVDALHADDHEVGLALAAELEGLLATGAGAGLGSLRLGAGEDAVLSVSGGPGAGGAARVDVVDLLVASLQLANRGEAVGLEVEALGDSVPVALTVVQPPQLAVGPPGPETVAETAQMEVDLTVDLDRLASSGPLADELAPIIEGLGDTIGDLLGPLCLWCDDAVDLGLGSLDVTVLAAHGASELTGATCPDDRTMDTSTAVTTAEVLVAGRILEVPEGSVDTDGPVTLQVAESSGHLTHFEGPFPSEPVTVPEGGASVSLALQTGDLDGTGDLEDVGALREGVEELLAAALLGDDGLLAVVLDELGLSLGSVDVHAQGLVCEQRRLQPTP
jgi:uncharacterized membrane protein